jgi:hypothetical protein
MTNTTRNLAYTLLVALVGTAFAACGGSSGGVDAGKDVHGDAVDAPVTDAATEHGDAAQPNDTQTSDVASNGDAGANDADASGDGSSDATGDVSRDVSSDTSSDASSDAAADTGADAAADTGADVSSDTSSDTTGDAGADSAADTAGGSDDAASDAADDVATCESTDTPTSCGICGLVCPGYQQPNDNVTCSGGTSCTFSSPRSVSPTAAIARAPGFAACSREGDCSRVDQSVEAEHFIATMADDRLRRDG